MSDRSFNVNASESVSHAARPTISALLLGMDVLLLVLTLSNVHGPWRFALGLLFAVTTPGWSVVGLLDLRDGAVETGLSVALSLAVLMLSAQVMMAFTIWHPIALEEFTCLICAPSLTLQSRGILRFWRNSR